MLAKRTPAKVCKVTVAISTLTETNEYFTDETDEGVDVAHLKHRVLWTQRHAAPQSTVVRKQTPFLADASNEAKFSVAQETETVEEYLVRKFVDVFLQRLNNFNSPALPG